MVLIFAPFLKKDWIFFEAKEELFDLLRIYKDSHSYSLTAELYNAKYTELPITSDKVESIITSINKRKLDYEKNKKTDRTLRHFKIGNFSVFNPILDFLRPIWYIVFLIAIVFIVNTFFIFQNSIFEFNRNNF